ncbi:MAG: 30S ribosomal protein S20 [Leptospiraceae bacterium]|nr:30S ribosomal protein S20 [Leptospiraceae bacterium]MDW7976296.1 30S ribosomal protein S20 [Leptospiraceae bacterium]
MANLKSSKKDIRRIERRRERNKAQKSRIKNLRKKIIKLLEEKKIEEAKIAFRDYCRYLDRAAKRNLIHWKQASRKKSRAALLINKKEKELLSAKS